jgi:hypothetical protein
MKKSKSSYDIATLLDKQYKATLLIAKMVDLLSAEIANLNFELKQQNIILNNLLSGHTLEEQTVKFENQ